MRITEKRMLANSAAGIARIRSSISKKAEQLSGGKRVSHASDNAAAWVVGKRATADATVNHAQSFAANAADDRLIISDQALGQVGEALARAKEMATQGANSTYNQEQRVALVMELRSVRATALAAANQKAPDGEYVLGGSQTQAPPFDTNGAYQGDSLTRSVETTGGVRLQTNIPGTALTAASGVDIFQTFADLEAALLANDATQVGSTLSDFDTAIHQVSAARTQTGALSTSLRAALSGNQDLDVALQTLASRVLDTDILDAASELATNSQALQAAQTVSQRLIDLLKP